MSQVNQPKGSPSITIEGKFNQLKSTLGALSRIERKLEKLNSYVEPVKKAKITAHKRINSGIRKSLKTIIT